MVIVSVVATLGSSDFFITVVTSFFLALGGALPTKESLPSGGAYAGFGA
jgi:hypothetical protein